jgi:hypothetical protein
MTIKSESVALPSTAVIVTCSLCGLITGRSSKQYISHFPWLAQYILRHFRERNANLDDLASIVLLNKADDSLVFCVPTSKAHDSPQRIDLIKTELRGCLLFVKAHNFSRVLSCPIGWDCGHDEPLNQTDVTQEIASICSEIGLNNSMVLYVNEWPPNESKAL